MASSSTAQLHPLLMLPAERPGLQGFERYAKRYEVEAISYARGLRTALFIQRFKQGLLNRP